VIITIIPGHDTSYLYLVHMVQGVNTCNYAISAMCVIFQAVVWRLLSNFTTCCRMRCHRISWSRCAVAVACQSPMSVVRRVRFRRIRSSNSRHWCGWSHLSASAAQYKTSSVSFAWFLD